MNKKIFIPTILTLLIVTISVSASYGWEDFKWSKCPMNTEIDGHFYGCGSPEPTADAADAAGEAQAQVACESWCIGFGGTSGIASQCNKLGGKSGSGGHQSVMKCDSCTCVGLAPIVEEIGGTFWKIGENPLF
ncbi:hypothetical protein HOA59_00860 [archaeon]|jgi:hypothetical protein|nr:hypothetical protein [archaeon]MBT6823970.1 hypothetical protein [archaeon]MBT7107200.1 hypothetical protein [archaeon]MBT7297730.1 hypothetical protein [archaeon]